jgi:iron(III) transport system ATP-binding protein
MAAAKITASSLTRRFGDVVAVDDVDFEIADGEVVSLLGPSGCGKTTLLRLIAGFESPDAGEIRIDGNVVAGGGVWHPPCRREVGLVFQDYALFPHLTVAENIGFGLPRKQRGERATHLLELMGLEGLGGRHPHQLSGGQQQRVAVARALAPRPRVVLLDEPWNTIDAQLRGQLRTEVMAALRAEGVTVVLVTHEIDEAFSLADRIVLMRDGRIEQVGTAEDLYYSPTSRWAASFVGDANFVPAAQAYDLLTVCGIACPLRHTDDGHLLIRPELLEPLCDVCGGAQVVAREFRGHDILYRIRLADGTELMSQRPSSEAVAVGSAVRLRVHDAPHGFATVAD